MKRYFRVFLFSIFLMFGLFDNANAASRMYIVPVSSADFTYIDDYVDIDVAYNTPCGRDNYDGYSGHEGMDFVLDLNTPVYAAASGTVHRDDSGNDYVQICSSVAANCYGYYMAIDHGGGNWTLYAHLNSYVVADGVYVNQGDLIAYSGNSGPTYPHLHWEVLTGGSSPPVNSHPNNPYYCDNEWFTSNPPTYADEYNAIDSKADELWAIRPRGSVSCDDHSRGGLICHEIQDMHWTDGDDPFILETWHDGAWGDVALTYDPDSNQGDRAYVVRSGFWADYQQRDWDVFGAPLGDELDENDSSGYSAYDPYCTPLYGSSNKASCIAAYCGSSRTFTSVQRFEHATLCWNNVLRVTQCDPTWSNPACNRNSRSATSVWSPAKGDLYDVNGTVYWYDGRSLRGIVSSDWQVLASTPFFRHSFWISLSNNIR